MSCCRPAIDHSEELVYEYRIKELTVMGTSTRNLEVRRRKDKKEYTDIDSSTRFFEKIASRKLIYI